MNSVRMVIKEEKHNYNSEDIIHVALWHLRLCFHKYGKWGCFARLHKLQGGENASTYTEHTHIHKLIKQQSNCGGRDCVCI